MCSLLAHSHLAVAGGVDAIIRAFELSAVGARFAARALDLACMAAAASAAISRLEA